MKIIKYILALQIFSIIILAVVQITASNMLSTDGIDLGHMQQRLEAAKKENILLNEKIYTVASLHHIASQATVLGFVPEKGVEFIKANNSIALK